MNIFLEMDYIKDISLSLVMLQLKLIQSINILDTYTVMGLSIIFQIFLHSIELLEMNMVVQQDQQFP